jgi:hypothetical protein
MLWELTEFLRALWTRVRPFAQTVDVRDGWILHGATIA